MAHFENAQFFSPSRTAVSTFDESVKRKLIELIVDLHGAVQKWQTLGQASFQTLTSLDSTYAQLQASSEQFQSANSPDSSECYKKHNVALMIFRESLIKDHRNDMMQMSELHGRMEDIVRNLEAIDLLSTVSTESVSPSYKSNAHSSFWTACDFYKASRSILNCYTKEWLQKQELSKTLSQPGSSRANTSLILSMWLQQPHLSEEADFKLKSMLFACGL